MDNPKHSDFGRLRSALLNTHLTDLKEITHDFLYENYRTEKLSKTQGGDAYGGQDGGSEDVGVRLKEEQLRREGRFSFLDFLVPSRSFRSQSLDFLTDFVEEKLREAELKSQREISEKRQELLAKEESLRNLETRLAHAQQANEAAAQLNNGHQ